MTCHAMPISFMCWLSRFDSGARFPGWWRCGTCCHAFLRSIGGLWPFERFGSHYHLEARSGTRFWPQPLRPTANNGPEISDLIKSLRKWFDWVLDTGVLDFLSNGWAEKRTVGFGSSWPLEITAFLETERGCKAKLNIQSTVEKSIHWFVVEIQTSKKNSGQSVKLKCLACHQKNVKSVCFWPPSFGSDLQWEPTQQSGPFNCGTSSCQPCGSQSPGFRSLVKCLPHKSQVKWKKTVSPAEVMKFLALQSLVLGAKHLGNGGLINFSWSDLTSWSLNI